MTQLVQRQRASRREWELSQAGMHPLLARLYAARGISAATEVDDDVKFLLPPTALLNADMAASLLADAIEAESKLLIVADYDCDGATACAVGIRALRAMGATVDYLVPNRFTLGYGLSPEIVDLAAQQQPDLIITVDNGIASIEGVARAQALGISTLITDHHLPGDSLPDADCIVNPNQPDCTFPSKAIAGVGVMFYVMLALRAELRERGWFAERAEPNLATLLDFVALGTIADVVKLDRNNRILVSQGMKRLRQGKLHAGIAALFQAAGKDPARVSAYDLGFLIAPRLNAAGRLADMALGIECLLTDDPIRALQIAQELDRLNRERRDIEADMQEQAAYLLTQMPAPGDLPALALFDPSWHQGVVGILASRLKEQWHRPVFAFARGEHGELKGSGRAIPGLHLRDALDLVAKRVPNVLIRFGGHAAAAGATLMEEDFPVFQAVFTQVAAELLNPEDLARRIETDGALEEGYYSLEVARLLDSAIWGQGFPPPLFADEFVVEQQRVLKDKHLKLRFRKGNFSIDAIRFNDPICPADTVRAAFRLSVNEYNGVSRVQLLVEHLEAC